jgi:hypothetical protein
MQPAIASLDASIATIEDVVHACSHEKTPALGATLGRFGQHQ